MGSSSDSGFEFWLLPKGSLLCPGSSNDVQKLESSAEKLEQHMQDRQLKV